MICNCWREGYDYPADDEDDGRDYFDEADEQHDKQQDQTLDQWTNLFACAQAYK